MPRKIQQPDGRWAVYSTVVKDFVLEDATREEVLVLEGDRVRERRINDVERLMDEHDGETSRGETYEDLRERSGSVG